jgi:hypothetical protein
MASCLVLFARQAGARKMPRGRLGFAPRGRTRDILGQFLVEAVTLSLIGGLVGVALGIGASVVIANLFGWRILLSPEAIGLAVAFAFVIGVFSAFTPRARPRASIRLRRCASNEGVLMTGAAYTVLSRVEKVRDQRLKSNREPTQGLANVPTLLWRDTSTHV